MIDDGTIITHQSIYDLHTQIERLEQRVFELEQYKTKIEHHVYNLAATIKNTLICGMPYTIDEGIKQHDLERIIQTCINVIYNGYPDYNCHS